MADLNSLIKKFPNHFLVLAITAVKCLQSGRQLK